MSVGFAQWLLGLGAPAVFAVIWGVLVAPKAKIRLQDPLRLGIEVLLFAGVAAALVSAGGGTHATAIALAWLNPAVMVVFGQRRSI